MVVRTTKNKNKNISTIFNLYINNFKKKCKKIKLEIKSKLTNLKWGIISEFKNSEILQYTVGSGAYILYTGILINSFTSFYLNFDVTLEGIIGSGGIMFLARYEIIEFIRDIQKKVKS